MRWNYGVLPILLLLGCGEDWVEIEEPHPFRIGASRTTTTATATDDRPASSFTVRHSENPAPPGVSAPKELPYYPIYFNTGNTLYGFDIDTEIVRDLGQFHLANSVSLEAMKDIAVGPNGDLFGAAIDGPNGPFVGRIEKRALVVPLFDLQSEPVGMAFVQGQLLIASDSGMRAVDPQTGATLFEPSLPCHLATGHGGIELLPDGQLLWHVQRFDFYRIDATFSPVFLRQLPRPPLAFVFHQGVLYYFWCLSSFAQMNPGTGDTVREFGSLLSSHSFVLGATSPDPF